jgi:uncharacterized membrane protein YdjX (TVP38/TMEM64 family)
LKTLLPTLAAIAIAAALVLSIDPLRDATSYALHGDVDGLQAELESLGVVGALVLVALILVHAVVLFPAEIPNAVAGLTYGFAVALPMVLAAWTASGLIAYYLGVWIGRPLAVRLAGEERVESAERVIGRGGVMALLLARLIPFIPFSLVGYIAGATRVPVWRYTWTSAVGVLPITAAAVYLGHALDDFSLSDPLFWVAVGTMVVLIVLTATVARRMRRGTSNR